MSVDGGKRVINADGDLIEAAVRLGIDAVNSAFSGGTKAPNANQQQVLIDAGYTLQQQNQANPRTRNLQNWIAPDGTVYGPGTSREIAQQLIRNPPAARPPAAGPTGPDNAGFPISIPLPSIPGLPSSIPLPPIAGPIISQALPAIITAGLFWPFPAGRGSDLRDLYGMPKPAGTKPRTRRGRRTRVRARPRAIPGRGNPFPATGKKGSSGPVTISRPARARPAPVAVPAKFPKPKVLRPGAGVKINTGPIKAPAPAKIPQTVTQRIAGIASTPFVRGLLGSLISAGLPSLFVKSPPSTRIGRVELPNTQPIGLPGLNPLTALQAQPLTYARPFPLTNAATQEQDCSCRPARKKSKKKPCKNPVTSRRGFKRGSRKFVTTTRELKCQA